MSDIGYVNLRTITKRNNLWSTINNFLFALFLFNVIFIPADTFNLKIVSLTLLLIFNCVNFMPVSSDQEKLIFIFGFIVTIATILFSMVFTGDIIDNIRWGYPGMILLLYFMLKKHKTDFHKILMCYLGLLAYFTVIMAALHLTGILPMEANPIVRWYDASSNALWGLGYEHTSFGLIFFVKSAVMLMVYALYCLEKRKYLSFLVTCAAVVVTGTRANVFILLFIIMLYYIFVTKNSTVRVLCILAIIFIAAYIIIDYRIIGYLIQLFNRKSADDAIRAGHLRGIMQVWKNNPLKFLFGSGYTSSFYSFGTKRFEQTIELSYFNLLRQIGLVFFIYMMVMYFYPILYILRHRKERKKYLYAALGYFAYLIVSFNDPFLYNSTGVTIMLYMYWLCFLSESVIEKEEYKKQNARIFGCLLKTSDHKKFE